MVSRQSQAKHIVQTLDLDRNVEANLRDNGAPFKQRNPICLGQLESVHGPTQK